MRFFTGLHQPSDAKHFDAAFVSVNRLRARKGPFPVGDWIMDSGAAGRDEAAGSYSMNWTEAIAAATRGATLRRKSEMGMRCIQEADPSKPGFAGLPVYETGEEGFRIMAAWSADEKPVNVFVGADSKVLFVPDDEQRGAVDWVIVP